MLDLQKLLHKLHRFGQVQALAEPLRMHELILLGLETFAALPLRPDQIILLDELVLSAQTQEFSFLGICLLHLGEYERLLFFW